MAIRVVFFGNSGSVFSSRHFRALLDTPCDLVAVVDVPPGRRTTTNPLPAGLPDFAGVARGRDIPVFEPDSPNDPAFVAYMQLLRPDLFIAAGYALILKPVVLSIPRLLAANFHASLLPDYRGKHPVFWTLRGGEKWAGLTVHAMSPGIDTGDILYQVKVRTRCDDSVATLYERIMARSVRLVGQLVDDAQRGTIPRRQQPVREGSYFSSTTEDDFRIDWTQPAERVRRNIVTTPGQCFADLVGRRIAFLDAGLARSTPAGSPGTLLQVGRVRAVVAAGVGAVWLGHVRLDDGRVMSAAALCGELGLAPGDTLAGTEGTHAAGSL